MNKEEYKIYILKKDKWVPLNPEDWELINDNTISIKVQDCRPYQVQFKEGRIGTDD